MVATFPWRHGVLVGSSKGVSVLGDGVIDLVEVNPAQAEELAGGSSPLPSVSDYPHADSAASARMRRDSLGIDNWVPGFGIHLIRRKSDGLVIGDLGFRNPPDERGVVEIGYGLAASARGMGYASRAVRLLVADAMGRGNVSCVIADTRSDNVASIRVLEATGFVRVRERAGELRFRISARPTRQPTGSPPVGALAQDLVVIVVFVPAEAAPAVLSALAEAGAGSVGEYSACSFSSAGQGRFTPGPGARPHIGVPGIPEMVDELRIECVCPRGRARRAISAMLAAHPYEQPAWHCLDTIGLSDLP